MENDQILANNPIMKLAAKRSSAAASVSRSDFSARKLRDYFLGQSRGDKLIQGNKQRFVFLQKRRLKKPRGIY